MTPSFARALWAIYRKDLAVWWRNRVTLVVSILPVAGLILVQAVGFGTVGRNPVALVVLDPGPTGTQMRQTFIDADVFVITEATPDEAQTLLHDVKVAAIVTIPADFTERVAAREPTPIDVTVNNLNLDFTNDIRRAVPDVITQFYESQGAASPIDVTIREQDLRARDVQGFQYGLVPLLIMLLTMNGVVTSGIAAAREWESRTVKEMLLAPVPRPVIIVGKVLAGFTATFLLGLIVILLGAALDWTRPDGVYWIPTILVIALVALAGTGLGVAVGAAVQRIQPVSALSILGAFYLFFLAGGIGVLAFDPVWLQQIAAFDPLAYGVHALAMAVFYGSSDLFGRDVLVLSASALIAIILGFVAMRRQLAN